jgi:hypothetical protein
MLVIEGARRDSLTALTQNGARLRMRLNLQFGAAAK